MKIQMKTILILTSTIVLSSCASIKLPEKGNTTVKDVYDKLAKSQDLENQIGTSNLSEYTSEKNKEILGLFKTLPNPDLMIYVFPHISSGGLPIPAYTTQIKLFEIEHYGLPNEKIEYKHAK